MTDPSPLDYGRETHTRRRRRLRRVWWWLWRPTAAVLVVLTIGHTIWLVRATGALDREVNALVAAGEPTTPAALQQVVPSGDNAFTLLETAAKIIKPDTLAYRRLNAFEPHPPLFGLERRRLQEYVDERSAAVPLIEQARAAPWNVSTVPLTSPLIHVLLPQLNEQRATATFQKYQVLLAHEKPDDEEALRLATGMETTANSAGSTPMLICMLVATGIRAMHADLLQDLAPTLRIGTAPGDASPARVRQTIADLLDTRILDAERMAAFRGERVWVLDLLRCMDDGTMRSPPMAIIPTDYAALRYVHRPYVRSNAATALRLGTARLAALGAPDWPTAQARLAAGGVSPRSYGLVLNHYVHLLVGSLDRSVHVGYRTWTERRLAAVALAARWHECETGRRPASWADLVPRYLPAIPLDPMAAGVPLQARFTGPDPIVWSVGENGVDESGSEHMARQGPSGAWATADRVIHLTRPPRVAEGQLKQLIDLDLDAPLAVTPPAPATANAATAPATAPQPPVAPTPGWDNVDGLTITALSGQIAGLATRRDLFGALATSLDVPADPSAATAPSAAIEGVVDSPDGTWHFTLRADKTVTFAAPDGTTTTHSWSGTTSFSGREFWE